MSVFVVHSGTLAWFQPVNFPHMSILIWAQQEVFKAIV